MITAAVVLVAAMFSVYVWLSTIEFGIALLRMWPKLDTGKLVNRLFTPMWEVTNVFLVFGFTGVAILFNNALPTIAQAVLSTLVVGLTALLVRAITVLYVFYYKPDEAGVTVPNFLFAVTSFLVPASFTAVGIYMITGQVFWQTTSGWVLMLSATALLFAMALSFVYWRSGDQATPRLQWLTRIAVGLFALLGAVVLQLVVPDKIPHLASLPLAIFVILAAATVLWEAALLTTKRADHGMWWYLSLVTLASPFLFAFANWPWLVYGSYTLQEAFGAQAYGLEVIIGMAVIFPVMIIGWALLATLLTKPQDP